MELAEFLQTVVTTEEGYFELCVRNSSWKQYWYEWPSDLDTIVEHATQSQYDTYFTSHLFKSRDSHKDNTLPSRTIQQDLDNADVANISLAPTVLVQTSPGRHQGFWIATTDFDDAQSHEQLSKKLCYSIPLCDKSGWPLGHKVRVPNTRNLKYKGQEHLVSIIRATTKRYNVDELELLPDITVVEGVPNGEFIESPPTPIAQSAITIIEQVKDSLSAKVYAEFYQDGPSSDRSASLFALETQLFRAGLSREEVYWVARHSPNDKFHSDLRFNADRELAKDVIRAETAVKSVTTNIRGLINDIRKRSKVLMAERRRTIYEMVLAAMQAEGEFVHVQDGRRYYIPRDTGHPIEVEMSSPALHSLLDVKYSLNQTEVEHTYTMGSLMSYTDYLPETAEVGVLSSYDYKSKYAMIHTGRKSVYVVSPDGIEEATNGTYNILFPWDRIVEPFTPSLSSDIDWGTELFSIPNVLNMTTEEAKTVLKVWLLFTLLRDAATSRPILAFFGQPGSGKTSTARRLYAFFYGRHMDVSGATSPVNYDISTATLPFYCLDNLDTWEKWIPDRLAQSAGKSDIMVRKLYTNQQTVRIKRSAMVCVTAHDPKFGRADVTDRMLILTLQRFSNMGIAFQDEGQLLNGVIANRNKLWGAVLKDLHKVLATPLPLTTDLQLRIQDFARLGEWISIAIGEQELFRQAILSLTNSQRVFNLDEDHILITSLTNWLVKSGGHPKPKGQDDLYREVLSIVAPEDFKTFLMLYKNSSTFVKRISNLQDTLNSVMDVSFYLDKSGQRVWRFEEKTSDTN
jgi:hypothetical protein